MGRTPGARGGPGDPDARAVLAFWFGDAPLAPRPKLWWRGGDAVDGELRARFGGLVARAVAGDLAAWEPEPRGRLALILLLDQFARHVFRGSADAFAGDERAQAIARRAVDGAQDRSLEPLERAFLYMPFVHAESRVLLRVGVSLFADLAADPPSAVAEALASNLRFAEQHRAIVERFGRYPYRNEALGRTTTPEEAAWLAAGGPRFGQ